MELRFKEDARMGNNADFFRQGYFLSRVIAASIVALGLIIDLSNVAHIACRLGRKPPRQNLA